MYLVNFLSHSNINQLFGTFSYLFDSFKDLNYRFGIKIIGVYQNSVDFILDESVKISAAKFGISFFGYDDISDVHEMILGLDEPYSLNSFSEWHVQMIYDLNKTLGKKVSGNLDIFLDKYVERSVVGSKFPKGVVNSVLFQHGTSLSDIDLSKLTFPLVIKPVGGFESRGVTKVYDEKGLYDSLTDIMNSLEMLDEKGLGNKDIIIEEFIDGKAYSVDYFVDENQKVHMTYPVYLTFGPDIGVSDFFNYYRMISFNTLSYIDLNVLNEFVNNVVNAGDIRNSFVHHEFKVNSQGVFKTIELNGRIGGYRLEIYDNAFGINLLAMLFGHYESNIKLKANMVVFAIYPDHNCVLRGFNENLISKIKGLDSFHRLNLSHQSIGKDIGHAKSGYGKVGTIVLKNSDIDSFENDVRILEENYFKILIVD